ncbi:MAG TPA: dTDP-4-amino-4,6-dideoxygalactose transaminase [Ignavibacteria bacterium]|nr:dTDP-4-amino-4,6-dideoxygalactose transaminase [Ignavibacteria bacterium]
MNNTKYSIPFNKPYFTGKETKYIKQAVSSGKISGDGIFTCKCQTFFEKSYGFNKVMLTTSCTDALEMAAILIDTKPGDEIIMPSYTFVSTANAFVLRGAKIVFADSNELNPNMDTDRLENLITPKTKAIVVMHYGGIACDMEKIMMHAGKYRLNVVEDAAQSIDSFYKRKPLGSFGNISAFSFHETKNLISGEGGMIVINDNKLIKRAEIIREKGTNRSSFFRGEVNKYGWVDIGSSYLPSEIIAAFLYAQLENLKKIQKKRISLWNLYYKTLMTLEHEGIISLPYIPEYAANNGHVFYIICKSLAERTELIDHLKKCGILAVFHYQSLHKSPFYKKKYESPKLVNSDKFSNCLLRLPLYYELSFKHVKLICQKIKQFYKSGKQ